MKTIELSPGVNKFRVAGVRQFGTVEPLEYTEGGWPKNTVTELGVIIIEFDIETKTYKIKNRYEESDIE